MGQEESTLKRASQAEQKQWKIRSIRQLTGNKRNWEIINYLLTKLAVDRVSYHVMINGDICVFLLRRTIYRPPLSSLTYSKTNTSHTNSLNQRVPKSSKVISPSKAKHTHTHTEIIIIIMGNALPGNSTEYHRQKRPSVLKFERAVSRIKTPVTVIKKWHSG